MARRALNRHRCPRVRPHPRRRGRLRRPIRRQESLDPTHCRSGDDMCSFGFLSDPKFQIRGMVCRVRWRVPSLVVSSGGSQKESLFRISVMICRRPTPRSAQCIFPEWRERIVDAGKMCRRTDPVEFSARLGIRNPNLSPYTSVPTFLHPGIIKHKHAEVIVYSISHVALENESSFTLFLNWIQCHTSNALSGLKKHTSS